MTGARAKQSAVQSIQRRHPDLGERLSVLQPFLQDGGSPLSYTQWEAYLAVCHSKVLLIAVPEGAPRDAAFVNDASQRQAQQEHLDRLKSLGRHPEIRFTNGDNLTSQIFKSTLLDLLARAGRKTKPHNLPYPSLGNLFKGREEFLDTLRDQLRQGAGQATAIVTKPATVHGLGGVGKTRLALEYAWRHEQTYAARLFVAAETPEALWRNLSELCHREVLDLPEQNTTEEALQAAAVLRWLQQHSGWLLIIDNVDTEPVAAEVEKLLAKLQNGHVLLTSRRPDWSAAVAPLALDVLAEDDAVAFLLERTELRRRKTPEDGTQARILAEELGGLALALEQAGAYIAKHRLRFDQYLAQWQSNRTKVLEWYDERLMQYPRSVAVTWQTSFDQLDEPARRLLQWLGWLAPEPIPESLLDTPVPEQPPTDLHAALAELEGYSLVARSAESPGFTVHRLVQDVTRRRPDNKARRRALAESLGWIDAAFTGNPQDVQSWSILEPLIPHAHKVADYADDAGITEPTARLMNQLGMLLHTKAQHAEAEPLYRRMVVIFLDFTRRTGHTHPHLQAGISNYVDLLAAMGKSEEEIKQTLADLGISATR